MWSREDGWYYIILATLFVCSTGEPSSCERARCYHCWMPFIEKMCPNTCQICVKENLRFKQFSSMNKMKLLTSNGTWYPKYAHIKSLGLSNATHRKTKWVAFSNSENVRKTALQPYSSQTGYLPQQQQQQQQYIPVHHSIRTNFAHQRSNVEYGTDYNPSPPPQSAIPTNIQQVERASNFERFAVNQDRDYTSVRRELLPRQQTNPLAPIEWPQQTFVPLNFSPPQLQTEHMNHYEMANRMPHHAQQTLPQTIHFVPPSVPHAIPPQFPQPHFIPPPRAASLQTNHANQFVNQPFVPPTLPPSFVQRPPPQIPLALPPIHYQQQTSQINAGYTSNQKGSSIPPQQFNQGYNLIPPQQYNQGYNLVPPQQYNQNQPSQGFLQTSIKFQPTLYGETMNQRKANQIRNELSNTFNQQARFQNSIDAASHIEQSIYGIGKSKPQSINQCPRQPNWEPCISKELANQRFKRCCEQLGEGCTSLCDYDASLTTIQLGVLSGRCPLSKVHAMMICASGNIDTTQCCEAYNVFESGFEHCRPYCNPAAGLPQGGLLSTQYKCLGKLSQIQRCFYVSQKP